MPIPLTLYIHIPWCVQKCPYCDFNSHALRTTPHIPENAYIEQLLADLDNDIGRFFVPAAAQRPLTAIFIGGGTPSLFSGAAIERLLHGVRKRLPVLPDAEITLEANPGAVDTEHYARYYRAGINRISIGVQSFHAEQLKRLGRIHTPDEAYRALDIARQAGFDNINIDLMFGLPQQTAAEALADIRQGIALNTEHLSYYQLTIEPHTAFAQQPPVLPDEDNIDQQFAATTEQLQRAGFHRYEVSAWSRGRQSQHNLNYWQHGDYLGIGAGAHGKITTLINGNPGIIRTTKPRAPKQYLRPIQGGAGNNTRFAVNTDFRTERIVTGAEKPFEFMLNALRLMDGFERHLMPVHGLFDEQSVLPTLQQFADKGLLTIDAQRITPTALGKRFINDMVAAFLP